MLFKYFKEMAEKSGSTVGNAVIAVPPFYNLQQRQIILQTCDVAGIDVIAIINEGTALGIQYGITKYKDVKKSESGVNVMFYDFGASSVKVSIGSLLPPKKKDSKVDLGELEMKSFSWSKNVGASMFDVDLAEHFARKYMEQNPGTNINLQENPKMFAKLLSHAKNVKKVLSVNEETVITIENIYKGEDFKFEITRKEFEKMCEKYLPYFKEPVEKALRESNLSLEDIHSIEVFGGGTRIPFVEREITKIVGREIHHSLNADEAIALGSTFYAASLSPMFRVKTFKIHDLLTNKIDFHLSVLKEGKEPKTYPLFAKYDLVGVKRSINIPRKANFSLTLKYGEEEEYLEMGLKSGEFQTVKVKGVDTLMKEWDEKYLSEEGSKARIRLTFSVNTKSQIVLDEVVATLERLVDHYEKVEKPKPEKKVDFEKDDNDDENDNDGDGNNEEEEDDEDVERTEEEKQKLERTEEEKQKLVEKDNNDEQDDNDETNDKGDNNEDDNDEDTNKKEEDEYVLTKKKKYSKLVLETENVDLLIPSLNDWDREYILERMQVFEDFEEEQLKFSKARNDLESLIYSIKYSFFEEEKYFKYYNEEQKEKLDIMLDDHEDFLYSHDEDTVKVSDFKAKYNEIDDIVSGIKNRYRETRNRDKELSKCQRILNKTVTVIETIMEKKPWLNVSEVVQLSRDLNETVYWLKENLEKIEVQESYEDPLVLSSSFKRKCELLKIRYEILEKKKEPKKPKVKKVKNDTVVNDDSSDGEDSEEQEEQEELINVEIDPKGNLVENDENMDEKEKKTPEGIKVEIGEEEVLI